jgi:hypothetical protein
MRGVIIGAAAGCCLAGCAVTPPLQEDGVAISDIVQRVKCELAYAVPDFRGQYPSGGFQWMKFWTAKVDLALDVNDLSSVKPNATVTNPVSGGSFTLGAGGEFSTQAERTEKLSFTLSMKELVENRRSSACELPEKLGLLGNLGLQEWIISALSPVENRQLAIGFHQPPTGKTASIPIAGPSSAAAAAPESPAKVLLNQALAALRLGEKGTDLTKDTAATARQFALKARFQATYDAVGKTYGYAEAAAALIDKATDLAWKATAANRDATSAAGKLSEADVLLLREVAADAKAATDLLTKAKQTATNAWELLPRDTPIDSITHTSKFVVTLGANVTPNWSLVQFKGPGLNSPFAIATRGRTNTLDVVLGAPAIPGGKALSDEQNRQLFNIQLDSLRRSLVLIQ